LKGLAALCLLSLTAISAGAPQVSAPTPIYEVYAVRFASVSFPVSSLVRGAERGRSIDIAFTVWVIKGGGRTVLVDAGFYRDKFIQQWKPKDYVKPSEALSTGLGIKPEDVTDIIVSHSHWDHADGLDLFPRAKVWIQRQEYEYYVGENGTVAHTGGVDADDAVMLFALNAAGRVALVDGDAKEILPGITVYTGGKHTYASQFAGVATRVGVVVLASDNAYLYENLEKHLAIAQTLDAESNLAALTRMLQLAASPRFVVPGHDPAVFERFPLPGKGVARIDAPDK
jgi:glyoxylase-like metal-dependent hydrolase (beta-lactamase superfamily II)